MEKAEADVIGQFGLGERNRILHGERLIDLGIEYQLVITKTVFNHHKRRLYTWTSLDGQTRNQIDYILIKQRWRTSLMDSKTLPGADFDADHELLQSKLKIKLHKLPKAERPIHFDLYSIPESFSVEIRNRFADLIVRAEEMTPNELWKEMKSNTKETAKAFYVRKRKRKRKWLTDATINATEQRRGLKQRGRQNQEYKQKCKEIRKDLNTYLDRNNTKKMHAEVKELIRKFSPRLNVIKDENGNTLGIYRNCRRSG